MPLKVSSRPRGTGGRIWISFIGMRALPYERQVCAALFPDLPSSLHAHLFLVCTQLCLFVMRALLTNAGFGQCYSLAGSRNFCTLLFLVCSLQ